MSRTLEERLVEQAEVERAEEREACAKICDRWADRTNAQNNKSATIRIVARELANAIRMRSVASPQQVSEQSQGRRCDGNSGKFPSEGGEHG